MQDPGDAIAAQYVGIGGKVTKSTDPTETGYTYTFGGWYKEEGFTNAWNFVTDPVTENTTLSSKWTQNQLIRTLKISSE